MAKPKYKVIIDDIVNDIQDGTLAPNDKLPSQRSLSHKYDVNRSTVVQALDILKSYGIIATSEKKGVYVSNQSWNSFISNNMKWQDFIGNNASKNNLYYVQKINELEFADNMIRMGTGELAPDLIPNHTFKQILSEGNLQLTTNYEEAKGKIRVTTSHCTLYEA
jgi:GntR family transcriptional regulator of abcA and norABC